MRGKGVEAMQRRLAKHYGLDESSLATGYFGPQTRQMVIKFQLEKGLIDSETDEVAGLVGPRTAKALNRL
jgi:peptidoglycan hydrolase-like protein with peptidoglycan-binding domain